MEAVQSIAVPAHVGEVAQVEVDCVHWPHALELEPFSFELLAEGGNEL